jgi:hypothetical protein
VSVNIINIDLSEIDFIENKHTAKTEAIFTACACVVYCLPAFINILFWNEER